MPIMAKVDLKDLDLEETTAYVEKIGLKAYRARQIRQWIFSNKTTSFQGMTNISKKLRNYLSLNTTITKLKILKTELSIDGTKKVLFELEDGNMIESVLIPERNHFTACISSQVGCAMGCKFCFTARQGFIRNLKSSEIINQVLQMKELLDQPDKLTNIVFMGMGEPLANFEAVKKAVTTIISPGGLNFSRRRVTISTCGLVPEIERLGNELPINLAVSLNAGDDQTRNILMPINKKYPLTTLIEALKHFPLHKGRRITFEYILISDINDKPSDATKLAGLLKDVRAKINLIPFNPHEGSPFQAPDEKKVLAFQDELIRKNYTATIRKSKGSDISAACGQLITAN